MANLTIHISHQASNSWCCLCEAGLLTGAGPHLVLAETDEPVCRECGKKEAPHLVALVDLAQVAQRVGRMCKHVLVPPMEVLLSLARAAEDFIHATPRLLKKAG